MLRVLVNAIGFVNVCFRFPMCGGSIADNYVFELFDALRLVDGLGGLRVKALALEDCVGVEVDTFARIVAASGMKKS